MKPSKWKQDAFNSRLKYDPEWRESIREVISMLGLLKVIDVDTCNTVCYKYNNFDFYSYLEIIDQFPEENDWFFDK